HVDGYNGIAAQLIDVDQRFKIVANHLLGNVIVTDTLEAANEIAGMTNRSFRIVTRDGDVVYPGGSMSGGAKKQTRQSLFTREKDLKKIAIQIYKEQELMTSLTDEISDLRERL